MASISTISPQQFPPLYPQLRRYTGERLEGFSPLPGSGASSTDPQRPDRVSLSPQADMQSQTPENPSNAPSSVKNTSADPESPQSFSSPEQMSTEELKQIQELQRRDVEVRAHEQAHLAAAGQYAAGGPSFTFQVGPNGKRYAVGGEVPISVSKESTPEETLQKMQVVAKAALAPLSPSAADRTIAAQAAVISAQARREIQAEALPSPPPESQSSDSASASGQNTDEPDTVRGISASGETPPPSFPAEDSNRRQMALNAYRSLSLQ